MNQVIDVTAVLDGQKSPAFHVRLVFLAFIAVIADGFDLGIAAFAGPSFIKEFSLKGSELGALLGGSVAAGILGPPVFGYFADRCGRKPVIIIATFSYATLTLAAIPATSFYQILVTRIVAGIVLAGVLPIVVTLTNEFAPRRAKATMVILMFTGVTFGGGLAGLASASLTAEHGWRVLFWIGGLTPVAIGFILWATLPESPKFLALRPGRYSDLAALMQRIDPSLRLPKGASFVIGGEQRQSDVSLRSLFEGRLALLTPLFWVSNFVALAVFFFIYQCAPTLLSRSGASISEAATATMLFQFGGTAAGLFSMRLLDKHGFLPVPFLYACAIPLVASIGFEGLPIFTLATVISAAGFCLLGVQFGNIGTEANLYPTAVRSWGVGFNFGFGRVGGGLGAFFGGLAYGADLSSQMLFVLAAIPLMVGFLVSIGIVPLYREHLNSLRLT
jgi:AAHS family 4-hydroxybenzoate transporter-like MFS transporter